MRGVPNNFATGSIFSNIVANTKLLNSLHPSSHAKMAADALSLKLAA